MALARGSTAWRKHYWGLACKPQLVKVRFGDATISVAAEIVEAVQALDAVQARHGYRARKGDTGSYSCRMQKGTTNVPSSHSWATAIDENWGVNPYRTDHLVTDMPRAMVDDVLALRTVSGAPVWRWGGDWDGRPDTPHSNYDAMHWEIVATPEELATGIIDPKAPRQEDDVAPRAIQIKGENTLYAFLEPPKAHHITSPAEFYVLAAGNAVSGEPQFVLDPGNKDHVEPIKELRRLAALP